MVVSCQGPSHPPAHSVPTKALTHFVFNVFQNIEDEIHFVLACLFDRRSRQRHIVSPKDRIFFFCGRDSDKITYGSNRSTFNRNKRENRGRTGLVHFIFGWPVAGAEQQIVYNRPGLSSVTKKMVLHFTQNCQRNFTPQESIEQPYVSTLLSHCFRGRPRIRLPPLFQFCTRIG